MRTLIVLLAILLIGPLWARDGFNGAAIERTQSEDSYDASGWAINYMARQSVMTVYAGYQWLRLDPTSIGVDTDERINLSGFQAGMILHPNFKFVRPFVGVGVFIGEDRQCTNSSTDCNHNGAFAVYPEAGFSIDISEAVAITAKARWYEFNDSAFKDDKLLSVSLAYYLD